MTIFRTQLYDTCNYTATQLYTGFNLSYNYHAGIFNQLWKMHHLNGIDRYPYLNNNILAVEIIASYKGGLLAGIWSSME